MAARRGIKKLSKVIMLPQSAEDGGRAAEFQRGARREMKRFRGTQLASDPSEDHSKLRVRMTSSSMRKNLAHRAGALPLLPPGGRATPETLFYLAGAVLVLVGVLLGYFNFKPRYSASEPIVVWKNDEPRLLREAARSGLLERLRFDQSSRADQAQGVAVSCSELGESWFKPVTNPHNEWGAASDGIPLSCEWTPGDAEVVIINR